MNQFFGNKNTLLFARKEDIQYATEKGAEGLRIYDWYEFLQVLKFPFFRH
jgi:hypothetical protein